MKDRREKEERENVRLEKGKRKGEGEGEEEEQRGKGKEAKQRGKGKGEKGRQKHWSSEEAGELTFLATKIMYQNSNFYKEICICFIPFSMSMM